MQRKGGGSSAPPLRAATVGLTPASVQQPHGLATTARRWGSTCTRWRRRAEPNLSSPNSLPLRPANRRDPRSGAAAGSAEELAATSSVRPTAGSGTEGLACPPPSWVRAEPEAAPVLRGNGASHHTLSRRGRRGHQSQLGIQGGRPRPQPESPSTHQHSGGRGHMHPLCTFQLIVWLVGWLAGWLPGRGGGVSICMAGGAAAADGAAAGAAAEKGAVETAAGGRRGYRRVRVPPVISPFTQVTAPGSPQPTLGGS